MRSRTIRADKVTVEAGKISRPIINRQTGNHEGQSVKADGNVVIEVVVPTNDTSSNEQHPKKGSVFKTGKANINAKKIDGPKTLPGKRKIIKASRDVTVRFREGSDDR